ncbi:hypothetical protein SAMN05421737_10243 [Shouchella lonarensis]|uniref:Uncharacterized protein n=1 Tax=Shouchella lonarensis TaxID=1464122 RepID=A0A1G6GX63_9BACI|nr:hypothetical protein SAMN05421737_10243 [Shouchella lonarensis]
MSLGLSFTLQKIDAANGTVVILLSKTILLLK